MASTVEPVSQVLGPPTYRPYRRCRGAWCRGRDGVEALRISDGDPKLGGGSDWSSMMLRNFRNVITDSSWIMDPIKRRIKYPEFSCFFQIFLSVFWNMIWLGGPFIIWQTSHTLEKPCIWFIKLVKRWSSQIWTPYMKNLKIIVKRIHRFQGPVSFRFYLLYATLHIWRFTHDCHLTFQVDALWNHSPTIDITM